MRQLASLFALALFPFPASSASAPKATYGTFQVDGVMSKGAITCAPGSTCEESGMGVLPSDSVATNTLTAQLGRAVHIADFVKPGETTIDAALPRAVAALPAAGGKILLDRSSSCYALTSAPTIMVNNVTIEGETHTSGCLTANYDGDTIKVGDGVTTVQNFTIRNVMVQSTIAKTSGAAVSLRGAYNARIENLLCGQNTYVCLDVNGGSNAFMAAVYGLRMPSGYIGIRVGNDIGQPADILIRDPLIGSASYAGIELKNASGVQISGGDVIGSGVGLLLDPGNGQSVVGLQGQGTWLDTSINAGLKISPTGTGMVSDSTWTGLWTASNGTVSTTTGQRNGAPGVLIQGSSASVRSITFNGLRSFNNGGEGVRIEGGAFIDLTGPQIGFNSLFANNTYSGIYVAAGISNWSVTGGRSGAGTGFKQVNQQKYGLEIAAGYEDFFSVVGVDLTGNVTGALSNGAAGSHQTIATTASKYTFSGENVGIGTITPNSLLTVSASYSRAYTDALAGGGIAQFTLGGGAAGEGIFLGVNAGKYSWIQSIQPGVGGRYLHLNPNGSPVALGKPSPAPGDASSGYPYIPVMSGVPNSAPQPITGMAPFLIDGMNNKLCAYVNSAWKCATLQ